jgi:hypothetical protein
LPQEFDALKKAQVGNSAHASQDASVVSVIYNDKLARRAEIRTGNTTTTNKKCLLFFSLGLGLIVLVLNDPHSALTREPIPHVGHVLQVPSLFRCFHLSR